MGGCGQPMTFPLWCSLLLTRSLLQQRSSTSHRSHQENLLLWGFPWLHFLQDTSPCSGVGAPWCESVPLWFLFTGSTQTPAPPRLLLPKLPQAARERSALTPGDPPSLHLSLHRFVSCTFSPPDPPCCAVVKRTCLPRGMGRKHTFIPLKAVSSQKPRYLSA